MQSGLWLIILQLAWLLLLVIVLTIIIFSTMKSLFQNVRRVCAFSSISSVCYHLSSAVGEKDVGRCEGWRAQPRRRGEPKGGSILIKGLGSEPRIKIATGGDWHRFLEALTARLTAAPRRRAVEPSRESARLPMMRWDGKITSDKPSARHPSLITPSAHTHTCACTAKVITTCMHVHTHTHTQLSASPPPRASNGTLAGWASTCPVSPAKPKLMRSHTYKIPLDVPQQSAATVLKGYLSKLSSITEQSLISTRYPDPVCQWPLFYRCEWTPLSDYCYYTACFRSSKSVNAHLHVFYFTAGQSYSQHLWRKYTWK